MALALLTFVAAADPISIAGPWQVRLDASDEGLAEKWFSKPLETDTNITLPGSLAAAGIGFPFDPKTGFYTGTTRPILRWPSAGYSENTRADELGAMVPSHLFIGPAWYERTIEIPAEWAGLSLRLTLERVKWTSRLWVNGREITGRNTDSLHAPHSYLIRRDKADSSSDPTRIRLLLRIDNRPALNIGFAGHGYGMETEPIWHGVAGTITLEPIRSAYLDEVHVQPRPDGSVHLEITGEATAGGQATVRAKLSGSGDSRSNEAAVNFEGESPRFTATLEIPASETCATWDEFNPNLYQLDVSLINDGDDLVDSRALRIGFRDFRRDGRKLLLNGTQIFLRGNLDCAIHPETDTPPTDRAWWERMLGIHKKAGFNHIRFHTWCPPEIAFDVADELGLYLQVETAYWVDNWIHDTIPYPPRIGEDSAIDAWVLAESKRILRAYGHHPSFMLYCLGNEFGMGTGWDRVDDLVTQLQQETDTILISGTTAQKSCPHDDYWVTHHSGSGKEAGVGGPVRGLGPENGSDWDFAEGVAGTDKPAISHETGQHQSWPDFDTLIPAFTGPIKAHNLTRIRARSEAIGITDHKARCEASVSFAHLLYKHEHEAMRRTPDFGGYQLLMLHDFTGQGEAFVGLLDPFYHEKPGITLDSIRQWNGPTVPLARLPSYLWTSDQTLTATLQLAHQGPGTLENVTPTWTLGLPDGGKPIASGALDLVSAAPGSLLTLGKISVSLKDCPAPSRLELTLTVGSISNKWSVWVYPEAGAHGEEATPGLHFAKRLDDVTLAALDRGETVILNFNKAGGDRFRQTRWGPIRWTGAWGWGSGLGLMCDPSHPALAGFPNDGHSDWQWHELSEGGTSIALDPGQATEATIIEQLSSFHFPKREAFLVEAKVGKGRLIACGFDIKHDIEHRPAARAFRKSVMDYAVSSSFHPALDLTPSEAAGIFDIPEPLDAVARADSEVPRNEAANAIDGNPNSFWHTSWGAIEPPHPHQLTIEFKKTRELTGIELKNRTDAENGRAGEVSVFFAEREGDWGSPVLDHAPLKNTADWQTLVFSAKRGRFLRIVFLNEVGGRRFSSVAEIKPISK